MGLLIRLEQSTEQRLCFAALRPEPIDTCRPAHKRCDAHTGRENQQEWSEKTHRRGGRAEIMPQLSSDGWDGRALVVGGGGIGRALATELPRRLPSLQVTLATRQPQADDEWCVDLESDSSLAALTGRLRAESRPLRLVFNATGRLHGAGLTPEKRLQHVESAALLDSFRINAAGPLLLAKAVEPCIARDRPFHFASLSARVGSIGDNRSGGWYAYRSAKAAQNMMLRCLSVEWARRLPLATVTLLHPGTTDTALSKPFQSFVPKEKLFSPERAAAQLVDVLLSQSQADTGGFLAWDGQTIPW